MFVNLRGHSTYSLLESIGTINQVLDKTIELGMDTICLAEYYVFSGAVEFYQKATKKNIKPIIGIELCFISDVKYIGQQRFIGNIVLLAQNKKGYYNLLKLISEGNKYKKNGKPCIDFNILRKYNEGLYILIGGEKSVFGQMLLQNENEKKRTDFILTIKEIVGQDNFFLDVIAQDYSLVPNLQEINNEIIEFSNKHTTKLLVNNNFHYINKDDKKYFETALAVRDGHKIYDEDRRKVHGEYHIMGGTDITNIMKLNGFKEDFIQILIQNNIEVASTIKTEIDLYQTLFPVYQTPDSIKDLYKNNKTGLVED